MQIAKNTSGSWDAAKSRVQSDLDTIEKTINDLQLQVATTTAALATVQTQLANKAATIAPGGSVTPYQGLDQLHNWLTTVAHDSSLSGLGTATSPLKLAPAAGGSTTLYLATLDLTDAAMIAGAGTRSLAAAITGAVLVPLMFSAEANQTVIGTNTVTINSAVYAGTTQAFMGVPITFIAAPGVAGHRFTRVLMSGFNIQSATQLKGVGLSIGFSAAAGATYATSGGNRFTILYAAVTSVN